MGKISDKVYGKFYIALKFKIYLEFRLQLKF